MGLLPVGTGNLLARNLDLPLTSTEEALAVVIGGRNRTIDVGWAQITEPADEPRTPAEREAGVAPGPARIEGVEAPLPGAAERPDESADAAAVEPAKEIFLVIAGLGFDAAMVADTDDELKAKVGWIAYFVAGMRHLHGRRMRVQMALDDMPAKPARLRSVLVGNCGLLPGGITLIPDAVLDDGELDVAVIDARGGLAGWTQVLGEVVMQRFGVRTELPARIGRIDHARARRVRVGVAGGEQAQVDGDPLGRANELEMWVEPSALVVRSG
jgi:diacylglycerol kinase family enzyme